ncbi:MAG: hypothetical protein BME93_02945 [Methanosarcinales archaeon Met12]|nr:MAG: hypothetical protein BME93_02945 [Methanosarcinales archaeon Met12]
MGKKNKCQECGFSDHRALHNHHVKEDKTFKATVTLCANCHNILHYDKPSLERYRHLEREAVEYVEIKTLNTVRLFTLIDPIKERLQKMGIDCQMKMDRCILKDYKTGSLAGREGIHYRIPLKDLEVRGWIRFLKYIVGELSKEGYRTNSLIITDINGRNLYSMCSETTSIEVASDR